MPQYVERLPCFQAVLFAYFVFKLLFQKSELGLRILSSNKARLVQTSFKYWQRFAFVGREMFLFAFVFQKLYLKVWHDSSFIYLITNMLSQTWVNQ